MTAKEIEEAQLTSEESEQTEIEDQTKEEKEKDYEDMMQALHRGRHEQHLKARTAVVTNLAPRRTLHQKEDLISFLRQSRKVQEASVYNNGQALILCSNDQDIRELARFCMTKTYYGRYLQVYRLTNEIHSKICPNKQVTYNHRAKCENMKKTLRSGTLEQRSVYIIGKPDEMEKVLTKVNEKHQSLRIIKHSKREKDKTSNIAISVTYGGPNEAYGSMQMLHEENKRVTKPFHQFKPVEMWDNHLKDSHHPEGCFASRSECIEWVVRKACEYWEIWISEWAACDQCELPMSADDICRWKSDQPDIRIMTKSKCERCKQREHDEKRIETAMHDEENLAAHAKMYYTQDNVNIKDLLKAVTVDTHNQRQTKSVEAIQNLFRKCIQDNGTSTNEGCHKGFKILYDTALSREPYEEPRVTTRALLGMALHGMPEISVGNDHPKCPTGNCKESQFEGSRVVQLCSMCQSNKKILARAAVEETLHVSEGRQVTNNTQGQMDSTNCVNLEDEDTTSPMEVDQKEAVENFSTTEDMIEKQQKENPDEWYNINGARWKCEQERVPGRCEMCQNKYKASWNISTDMTDEEEIEYCEYVDEHPYRKQINNRASLSKRCCSRDCVEHHIGGKWYEKRDNHKRREPPTFGQHEPHPTEPSRSVSLIGKPEIPRPRSGSEGHATAQGNSKGADLEASPQSGGGTSPNTEWRRAPHVDLAEVPQDGHRKHLEVPCEICRNKSYKRGSTPKDRTSDERSHVQGLEGKRRCNPKAGNIHDQMEVSIKKRAKTNPSIAKMIGRMVLNSRKWQYVEKCCNGTK